MAAEKPPSSAEGGQSEGKSNRRRSFRSKRRNRNKPSGESAPPRPAPAPASNPASNPAEAQDKAQRDRRDRRRRRRAKSKQRGQTYAAPERAAEDIMQGLPSLQPVFVYTHVIRPSARDSYEFRTEHFGKATRRLEDFHIDLAAFFRSVEEDEARLAAASRGEAAGIDVDEDWDDDWDEDDEDEDADDGDATGPVAEAGEAPVEPGPVDLTPTDNDDELN